MKTSNGKGILIITTFIIFIFIAGFAGLYIGSLNKTSCNNHEPEIKDMWISRYYYPIYKDGLNIPSSDIWPIPYPDDYPYAYNVDVRDLDGDFMSVRFYIKQGNNWVMEQEQFGRSGIYTFYPYVYEHPIPMENYYKGVIAKIVISDNVNTVSKMF